MSPLPTFEDLKGSLSTELEIVKEDQRDELVRKIRWLIRRKEEFERRREDYRVSVAETRMSIKSHKKVFTQLVNAIKSIKEAEKIAEPEDPTMLKNLGVLRAKKVILAAAADIQWMKDELFPATIHPDLRKGREVGHDLELFSCKYSATPGLGKAKVDHWLMGKLDKSLDGFVTPDGKTIKVGRDKLIQKVFLVAFKYKYEIKTINFVRHDQRKKRSRTLRKLLEN